MRVVGPKQQKILDLLAERGALCLATVLAETSPNPAGRGLVQQAIRRLCDTGSPRSGRNRLNCGL